MIMWWYRSDFDSYYPGGLTSFLTDYGPPAAAEFVAAFGTDTAVWGTALSYFTYDRELNNIVSGR